MPTAARPDRRAILEALFVAFLWSTSWILIKTGLRTIPALTFAGLRYTIGFVALFPLAFRRGGAVRLRSLDGRSWAQVTLLGLLFYGVTQGAQFVSLLYLPAATTSLLLSFTSILVAGAAALSGREAPTLRQWAGLAMYLAGTMVYLRPAAPGRQSAVGLSVAALGVAANAASSLLGRRVNARRVLDPVEVTCISMGIGGTLLLGTGLAVQGMPRLSAAQWGIVLWLALVNGALAFTLWNRTLRTLTATQSSILNNTMLFQIAVLAWVFLGESLAALQIAGVLLAGGGVLLVQLRSGGTVSRGAEAP